MRIERLPEHAWERLRAVRLAALRESPHAFGTRHEDCVGWANETWQEQLRTLATFVAVVEGRDVGMVRGVQRSDIPSAVVLISMWVGPDARRRGVGGALVDAVAEWARNHDKTEVFLDVRTSNATAIAFYERKGFAATGEVKSDPEPEAQYVLRLAAAR